MIKFIGILPSGSSSISKSSDIFFVNELESHLVI